jgi:hypothetical protein
LAVVDAAESLAVSHRPLLARALANLDWPAAVPLLAGWLGDPATPATDATERAAAKAAHDALSAMKSDAAREALDAWAASAPAIVVKPKAHPFDDIRYFPARSGNRWRWATSVGSTEWYIAMVKKIDTGYAITITQTNKITKTGESSQSTLYYQMSFDGKLEDVILKRGNVSRETRLMFPLETDRTWQEATDSVTRVYTVVSRDYTISNSGGEFTNVVKFTRIEDRDGARSELAWYVAPNVGLVRIEFQGKIHWNLESYTVDGNDLVRLDEPGQ